MMHTLYIITENATGKEILQTENWDTFAEYVNQKDDDGNLLYSIECRTIYDS